jgi:hypothetical protein
VLAPPAPSMRFAVRRAASLSRLGAALLLAALATSMSLAVRRAASLSPLGAALQLTLPPAHGPMQQPPTPLSPQRSASAHRTYGGGSTSRSDVGFSMSRSTWSRALGRGTYGGCVVGADGQALLRTLHRQVRGLLARRAASPNPDGRFEPCPHHTATRRPQHDGGTPWSVPAVLRVGLL